MIEDFKKKRSAFQDQVSAKNLVFVVVWAILFTLAYAQSPLYTSNQNQYFLHGLAKAGYGNLTSDWLVNTIDPTPVFSFLVYITYKLLPWTPIFYFYYGILAAVYLFSLMGIVNEIFQTDASKTKRWLFLTIFILLHSAGLRYLIVRVFSSEWAYLLDGGVAGQRLLGSVLQPSAFGVFLLLAIYLFLRRKFGWSILLLALTPSLHPTYLLSAGVLTLVFMGMLYFEKKKLRDPLIFGMLTLLGVMPILIHTFFTFGGTSPELTAQSRQLLVDFRIPHHAIPAAWLDGSVIIKVAIVLAGLYLSRKTRLFSIILWPFSIAAAGTILQLILDQDVLALMFPWRQSAWLLPLALSVVTARVVARISLWLKQRLSEKLLSTLCLALVIGLAGAGLAKTIWENQEKHNGADRPMMSYVNAHKTPGEVYLIPLDMQDFRLETGAPAYVEFKSIPYKDVDVLEWYRRVTVTGNFYRIPYKRTGCEMLVTLYQEGVTHIVLPYDHLAAACWNVERLYLGFENYEVYKVLGE